MAARSPSLQGGLKTLHTMEYAEDLWGCEEVPRVWLFPIVSHGVEVGKQMHDFSPWGLGRITSGKVR